MSQVLQLKRLKVVNFRSIKEQPFILHDFAVLIGKNNSGKTNLLDAVALLLEGTAKSVEDADFWDKSKNIQIDGEFHNVKNFLPLCSDKNKAKVEGMISTDGILRLRRKYGQGVEKSGALLSFDEKTDEDKALATGIDAELKRFLPEVVAIKALADVSDEATGKTTGTLGKLLGQIMESLRDKAQPELDKAFETAKKLLNVVEGKDERVQELRDVESDITGLLQETFTETTVRLNVELPDVKRLLADVAVAVDDGDITPYFRKGHGLQRSLYLSLIRALAKRVRVGQQAAVRRPIIILFEEPELFLHPSAQEQMREALAQISKQNQVLIATHSPSMVSIETFGQLVLIQKNREQTENKDGKGRLVTVTVSEGDSTPPSQDEKDLLHILNLHRASRAFFFRRVMLVEGPSDVHLVNAIAIRLNFGNLEAKDCTVIETGGKEKLLTFQELLEKLGIIVSVLADDDFLWRGAGPAFKNDPEFSQFCQAVSKFGDKSKARREGLAKDAAAQKQAESLIGKLAKRKVFVLSKGAIEHYVGLSENSKGDYVDAAKEISNGTRKITEEKELEAILKAFIETT
jgi:putative ATP-dependent endonuclease of the OLD family